MDGIRAGRQLRLIGEVVGMAAECGFEVWLRGGWAMDFFLGEVTRDHRDIDWFAWAGDADALGVELGRRGHRAVPGLPADQQLDVVKDGEDLSFNLLRRDESGRVVVGGGPWAGVPWPEGMLEPHRGRIGAVECPIIAPDAQIEIKRMMPVWVPGMPRRAKDAEDIARIEAASEYPDVPQSVASPDDVETLIHVAAYLGSAIAGGIIGNRADTAVVGAARRMFRAVHAKWRSRATAVDVPLTEVEAIYAAKAAALACTYVSGTPRVEEASRDEDGWWTVYLEAWVAGEGAERLRVRVPPGDPANATILVLAGAGPIRRSPSTSG